ncbi:TPA: hypothetical protein O8T99_002809 [Enterobacter asburiae]|nr:hypothetical protein [Enterobacter asburiae]
MRPGTFPWHGKAILVVVKAGADVPGHKWSNNETTSASSRPPQTKPTTWDPSAREPTLPYPHIASLSLDFLFQVPGTILDMPSC